MAPRPAARGSGTGRGSHAEYGASATSPPVAPAVSGSATAQVEQRPGRDRARRRAAGRAARRRRPHPRARAGRRAGRRRPGRRRRRPRPGRPTDRAPSTVSSAWLARSGPPGATTTTVAPRGASGVAHEPIALAPRGQQPGRRADGHALGRLTLHGAHEVAGVESLCRRDQQQLGHARRLPPRRGFPRRVARGGAGAATRPVVHRARLAGHVDPVEAQHVLGGLATRRSRSGRR